MAKKKVEPKEENDTELTGLEDNLIDESESEYPKLDKEGISKKPSKELSPDTEEDIKEEAFDEDLEFEYEEEEPQPIEYKFLDLSIVKGLKDNDYKLMIEGQSHGFCNILVKHLLQIEGVKSAAYKVTQIDPPEVFLRIEEGFDIKEILHKGIDGLKGEVNEVQQSFKNLMK